MHAKNFTVRQHECHSTHDILFLLSLSVAPLIHGRAPRNGRHPCPGDAQARSSSQRSCDGNLLPMRFLAPRNPSHIVQGTHGAGRDVMSTWLSDRTVLLSSEVRPSARPLVFGRVLTTWYKFSACPGDWNLSKSGPYAWDNGSTLGPICSPEYQLPQISLTSLDNIVGHLKINFDWPRDLSRLVINTLKDSILA